MIYGSYPLHPVRNVPSFDLSEHEKRKNYKEVSHRMQYLFAHPSLVYRITAINARKNDKKYVKNATFHKKNVFIYEGIRGDTDNTEKSLEVYFQIYHY